MTEPTELDEDTDEAEREAHRNASIVSVDTNPVDMAALFREQFERFAADYTSEHGLAQKAAIADIGHRQQTVMADLATIKRRSESRWWDNSWIRMAGFVCAVFGGVYAVGEKLVQADREIHGYFNSQNERTSVVSARADAAKADAAKALEWIGVSGNDLLKRQNEFDYRVRALENSIGQLVAIVTHNREERVAQIDEIRKDKEGVNVRLSRIEAKIEDMASALGRLEERSRSDNGGRSHPLRDAWTPTQPWRSSKPPPPPRSSPVIEAATPAPKVVTPRDVGDLGTQPP